MLMAMAPREFDESIVGEQNVHVKRLRERTLAQSGIDDAKPGGQERAGGQGIGSRKDE